MPKHNQPNKWRLIVDLSSPDGQSVNAGLDKTGGQGSNGEAGLKDAYRIVPVHPDDRPEMVDTVLPFGLRSAPTIFSAVADGLCIGKGLVPPSTTWMTFSFWDLRTQTPAPGP